MKKEFMLYSRNASDAKAALTADEHLAFIPTNMPTKTFACDLSLPAFKLLLK